MPGWWPCIQHDCGAGSFSPHFPASQHSTRSYKKMYLKKEILKTAAYSQRVRGNHDICFPPILYIQWVTARLQLQAASSSMRHYLHTAARFLFLFCSVYSDLISPNMVLRTTYINLYMCLPTTKKKKRKKNLASPCAMVKPTPA